MSIFSSESERHEGVTNICAIKIVVPPVNC